MGFDVLLIGRLLPNSSPIDRSYATKRFKLLFKKKAFFYFEYNFRLFLFLLFNKADLLIANDIDTALANHAIQKIKKTPLIIDCHEYFCGVPELLGRTRTIRIWKRIEKAALTYATQVITVNDSIAALLSKEYQIEVKVIKNVPSRKIIEDEVKISNSFFPYIIYQGAVNIDRGIEEMIEAMQFLPDYHFVIAGKGDILQKLQQYVATLAWKDTIIFLGSLSPEKLRSFTRQAVLGVSMEKDTCINYHYCLPNKLFDYIQSGIPVLVSDLPEMRQIVERYQVGEYIGAHDSRILADKIKSMLDDSDKIDYYRQQTIEAAKELCWEKESKLLENIFSPFLKK